MKKPEPGSEAVDTYLAALAHPMKESILRLRGLILSAGPKLTECIKWNAPSFRFNGHDCLTMRLHPPVKAQVIFHRGAAKRTALPERFIQDDTKLLEWPANDRAVLTLRNANDLDIHAGAVQEFVRKWTAAIGKEG